MLFGRVFGALGSDRYENLSSLDFLVCKILLEELKKEFLDLIEILAFVLVFRAAHFE